MELHHLSEWRVHCFAAERHKHAFIQVSRGDAYLKILLVFTNIWLLSNDIVQLCTCHPNSLSLSSPLGKSFKQSENYQLNKYDPYKNNNTKRHFNAIFMVEVFFLFWRFRLLYLTKCSSLLKNTKNCVC